MFNGVENKPCIEIVHIVKICNHWCLFGLL